MKTQKQPTKNRLSLLNKLAERLKKLNFSVTKKRLAIFISVVLVVVIICVVLGVFLPKQSASPSSKDLVKKIGRLIELPKDEEPTVALVSDVEKLKGQVFFANAQNGDQVLIYSNAKKAILYRPSINKLIEVSSLAINTTKETTVPPPTEVQPTVVKVAILNGTKTAGLASSTEVKLKQLASNIQVISKGNSKRDYQKTIIVDLKGNLGEVANDIMSVIPGNLASMPTEETVPAGADMLIILGQSN